MWYKIVIYVPIDPEVIFPEKQMRSAEILAEIFADSVFVFQEILFPVVWVWNFNTVRTSSK